VGNPKNIAKKICKSLNSLVGNGESDTTEAWQDFSIVENSVGAKKVSDATDKSEEVKALDAKEKIPIYYISDKSIKDAAQYADGMPIIEPKERLIFVYFSYDGSVAPMWNNSKYLDSDSKLTEGTPHILETPVQNIYLQHSRWTDKSIEVLHQLIAKNTNRIDGIVIFSNFSALWSSDSGKKMLKKINKALGYPEDADISKWIKFTDRLSKQSGGRRLNYDRVSGGRLESPKFFMGIIIGLVLVMLAPIYSIIWGKYFNQRAIASPYTPHVQYEPYAPYAP
jgi:hypothetical protein